MTASDWWEMTYWRLFYHIVWATKNREPLIGAQQEEIIRRSIRTTCESASCLIHGIGIMPDHVHVALSIPPKMSIWEFMHQLKGSSSHLVRQAERPRSFRWQPEYGVLSFHEDLLPKIVAYVENQRQHHTNGTIRRGLEQTVRPYSPAPPAR
jgi:putative transposase